jgi:acyl-CoA synthetase (AMP-forming)/AMP-acid ligase II
MRVLEHGPRDVVALGVGAPRTASDLVADAGRVAAALAGWAPGEVVLACRDRYLFVAALLGAWQAGHVVVLPQNAQPDTVRTLCLRPDVRTCLHDLGEGGAGIDVREALSRPPSPTPWHEPDLGRHLVTLMTSGSTGPQEPCAKIGAQLIGEAATLAAVFGVGPGARVLASVPPSHIYGLLFGILMPLQARAAFVRDTPLHVEAVADSLRQHRATHFVSVPAHLAALAQADELPLVECAFSSGARLPDETTSTLWERFGWHTVEVYGSTETGGIAWRSESRREWRALPGVSVAAAADGRLLLDSPFLAPGGERPFRGADLVAPTEGGSFRFLGRQDGVVKVAGRRVSLQEIEQRLLAIPGVRDAAALASPTPKSRGHEVWVAVAATHVTARQVRQALSTGLDAVALPRRIRIVDALPREDTGKIVRQRLQELFRTDGEGSTTTAIDPAGEHSQADGAENDTRVIALAVPRDLACFRGHFEGKPVLPGVFQLHGLVLRQVNRLWPDLGAPRRVRRLKFKRVIEPGTHLELRLSRDPREPRVNFEIESSAGSCASGTVVFGSTRNVR